MTHPPGSPPPPPPPPPPGGPGGPGGPGRMSDRALLRLFIAPPVVLGIALLVAIFAQSP